MRALVLEDFGRMTVREVPDATAEAGHVLLRIHATGICGSDLHGFTGENGRRRPGQVMGHESVGRIVALGPGVPEADFPIGEVATFNPVVVPEALLDEYRGREQRAPGKTVIGVHDETAAFAEYLSVPARNVMIIGSQVPIEHGALVEPLAVAAHAVARAGVRPGQRLLVIGGGPVGQSVVIAAVQAGAREVVVSELAPTRRELCARIGAKTVDPAAGADLIAEPVDVAIDAVGVTVTLREALRNTIPGGVVCLVGMGAPGVELEAFQVSTEERTLVGSFTYTAADFDQAAEWVREGVADFEALISKVVDLDEAHQEFSRQAAGELTAGKVLVRLAPDQS